MPIFEHTTAALLGHNYDQVCTLSEFSHSNMQPHQNNTHSTYLTTLIDVHAHSQSLNRTLPVVNSSTLTQPPNHLQTVVHCMLPCLFTPTQKCLPYCHTLYLRIQYLFCHTNIYSTYVHPSHAHSHPPPYSSLTTSLYTSHDMEEVRYALEPDPL